MRHLILTTSAIAMIGLAGCEDRMTRQEAALAGGAAGAAAGYLTAQALDANDEWTIAGTLAGAVIGAKVAQNRRTNECAYYIGNGYYDVRRC